MNAPEWIANPARVRLLELLEVNQLNDNGYDEIMEILSEAQIEQIPWDTIGSEESSEQPACTICLEEFVMGERVRRLECGHLFHQPCILLWLLRTNSCPLCRTRLLFF